MTLNQYKNQILQDPRATKLNFKPDGKQHLVYRITNIIKLKHYYGSKSNSKILGEGYLSSSTDKEFIEEQKSNPEHFKYKIIKTYDNTADKMIHESFLHQNFDVKNHNSFYNKANQTAFGFDTTGNDELSLKISKRMKGKTPWNFGKTGIYSDKSRDKMGAKKGRNDIITCPHCGKSGGRGGMNRNHFKYCQENPTKIEKPKQTMKIKICPHCSKSGSGGNMTRYHFDNCKNLQRDTVSTNPSVELVI